SSVRPKRPLTTALGLQYGVTGLAQALVTQHGLFQNNQLRLCRQQAAAQREVCTENGQTECVICLGDGAHLLAGEGLSLCPAPYRLGRANGICLAAEQMVQKKQCISAAALSPEYHRLSQAQRERAQKESVLL
ncbi:MAG: hypothetical protein RSC00_10045, partial [Ruthenibacterium sp.]